MAAGDPGTRKRNYSATAVETKLLNSLPAAGQGDSTTGVILNSISGFPTTFPYTLIIDPDTSKEEVVTVTSGSSTTIVITRGEDNTQATAHSAGTSVRHGVSAREFKELQTHIAARGYDTDSSILSNVDTHVHGLGSGDGDVVGTSKTQTLSNKTLTAPTITGAPGFATSIVFEGATDDAYETTLTVTDPTADRTITLPNATGQVVLRDTTDTLTNKTLTSPTISGTPVITGLSSAGMSSSSATPKDYVDAILGSATAASTSAASAATSATSAATSATSAAASATASASSASAAATSATAAATSASSASTSATAAATSATSAAASATAAATSATSAAASATAAAASVSSIATYATNAANSETAAATSATSAANSASAASTSATSAANSATASASSASAAATSATSAAASATAAATSATNAATSASSAATSATAAATSATSAAASATAAATSATSAAASATSAAASAATAATSAANAATSATSAATSASSASTSASSAATTYTNYDQRYLGSKSSAPSVDNLGNALITGATYWNSTTSTMYAWSGSAWLAVSASSAVSNVLGTSGRISSSGGSTPQIDLVATAVTAGTYATATITVDAYGRITDASASDLTQYSLVVLDIMGVY